MLAVLMSLMMVMALAPAAHAMGNISWSSVCAGYTGSSWYQSSTARYYSSTTASDNDKVGAANRYYQGNNTYAIGYGYTNRYSYSVQHGGWHSSYCWTGHDYKAS